MAQISISDLKNDDIFDELTLQKTANISGGGLTPSEGLAYGTSVLSAGIGVVAIASGPVGWLAGGFLYGGGLLLSCYSATRMSM